MDADAARHRQPGDDANRQRSTHEIRQCVYVRARTGGDAAAEQARLLRRQRGGGADDVELDEVRDVHHRVLGEAGDAQEAVDGLASGGEREARGAVPRHDAGAVRQRGADVAAGGDAVGALPALRQEHRHHRVAHAHFVHMVPHALHHTSAHELFS